jgi:hypothetical protein
MSTICSLSAATAYTPPVKAEGRNEPKHDNDADDRGPKALSAAAAPAANPTSSGVQLSSGSLAALVEMQAH